jgi:hypothetical protein
MTYTVRVDDNYHYMDADARYPHGEFECLADALLAAQAIVDDYLSSAYAPGMSADPLYQSYTCFGADPFILGPGDEQFSAWTYAKARCAVICAAAT